MAFQLHQKLQEDCIYSGKFELCRLLIMNDCQYPWFVLVPETPNISEIYQLNKVERNLLIEESSYLSENLVRLFTPDKMNIAAIGNIVPQLHIHHVVRYQSDKSWPQPVWGKYAAIPYEEGQINDLLLRLDFLNLSKHAD
jgi:diadenosine tetraphosphate (Ap4A) HIT family hydrolase